MSGRRKAGSADAVRAAITAVPAGRYLLAVSGGCDSMVLLDAFAAARADIAAVATFDHGTGDAAERAAEHVEIEASRRELPVVSGRGGGAASEDALRAERWAFLRAWAAELGAQVVTAHTEDDQVETVFMRILRDSGARGLAAMYAPGNVVRPLLAVRRADVVAYAESTGLRWIDDPSNASTRYLRNRVRAELLPAVEAVHPHFPEWLLHVAREAAAWRRDVAAQVDALGVSVCEPPDGSVVVPAAALAGIGPDGLAVVWPEIASRAGVTVDRRGSQRLVRESPNLKPGGVIPLSGAATVRRTVSTFVVRNSGVDSRLY